MFAWFIVEQHFFTALLCMFHFLPGTVNVSNSHGGTVFPFIIAQLQNNDGGETEVTQVETHRLSNKRKAEREREK